MAIDNRTTNISTQTTIDRHNKDLDLLSRKKEILSKIANYDEGSITTLDIDPEISKAVIKKRQTSHNNELGAKNDENNYNLYNQVKLETNNNNYDETKNDDDDDKQRNWYDNDGLETKTNNSNSPIVEKLETKDNDLSNVEKLECYILTNLNTLASQRLLDVGTIPRALVNAVVALMRAEQKNTTSDDFAQKEKITYEKFIDKLKGLCENVNDNNPAVTKLKDSLENEEFHQGFLAKKKNKRIFDEVIEKGLFFTGTHYEACSLNIKTNPRSGYYARQYRILELKKYINFLTLIINDIDDQITTDQKKLPKNQQYNEYHSIHGDLKKIQNFIETLKKKLKEETDNKSRDFREAVESDYEVKISLQTGHHSIKIFNLDQAVLRVLQHTPYAGMLNKDKSELSETGKDTLKAAKISAMISNMREHNVDKKVIQLSNGNTMTITQTKLDHTTPAAMKKMMKMTMSEKVIKMMHSMTMSEEVIKIMLKRGITHEAFMRKIERRRKNILDKVNILQNKNNDINIDYKYMPVNFREKVITITNKTGDTIMTSISYNSGHIQSPKAAKVAIKEIQQDNAGEKPIICLSYMNGGPWGNRFMGNESKKYRDHRENINHAIHEFENESKEEVTKIDNVVNPPEEQKVFHLNLPTGRYTDWNPGAADIGNTYTDLENLIYKFTDDIEDLHDYVQKTKAKQVLDWIQRIREDTLNNLIGFTSERADQLNALIHVLASILGYIMKTDCKSGKDRTTMEEITAEISVAIATIMTPEELASCITPEKFFNLIVTTYKHDAQQIAKRNNMSEITFQNTLKAGNINPNGGMWLLEQLDMTSKSVRPMKR